MAVARGLDGLDVPVMVLGRGSNLLVADAGFDGLVISLGAGFESLSIDGHRVRAGAALALPVLARRTVAAGLHGLEWAVGVPGSVGGAIRMNAGGHGSDTASTLVGLRWVDLDGRRPRDPGGVAGPLVPAHRTRPRPTWWWPPSTSWSSATSKTVRPPSPRSCAGGGPTSPGGATPDRCSPIRPTTPPAGWSRPAG